MVRFVIIGLPIKRIYYYTTQGEDRTVILVAYPCLYSYRLQ